MRNDQHDPTRQMQRTSINQARTVFEQSFELQRNATKMFLSLLEMQDTAGRQGIELTKSMMRNYLEGVESIMPEMEQAMERGMTATPMTGGSQSGEFRGAGPQGEPPMAPGRAAGGPTERRGGQRGAEAGGQPHRGQRTEASQEMHGGGEPPATGERGEERPQPRTGEPISQPSGSEGGGGAGMGRAGGQQPAESSGRYEQPETGGYGQTGRWIPREHARESGGAGRETARPGGRQSTQPEGRRTGQPGGQPGTYPPARGEGRGRGYEEPSGRGERVQGEGAPGRRTETRERQLASHPTGGESASEGEPRETTDASERTESTRTEPEGGGDVDREEIPDREPESTETETDEAEE